MASYSLIALSLGLVCFLAVKVLVSAFYARQNTKFPVKVAVIAMIANVVFNFTLIGPLAHAGLALASTLSSMLNVGILLWALLKQQIYIPQPGWKGYSLRLLFSNGLMAGLILWLTPDRSAWVEGDILFRAGSLFGLMGGAMVAYFGGLWLTGLRVSHLRLESA